MWHFSVRKNLSAYLDGELDRVTGGKIQAHLEDCPSCVRLQATIREGKALASHFESPEWSGSERLWQNVWGRVSAPPRESSEATPAGGKGGFMGWSRTVLLRGRPALLVGVLAVLVFANLFVVFTGDRHRYQLAGFDWMSDYVFNYGLYLTALSEGQTPTDFEVRYASHPVTYDEARRVMPFPLATFSSLPEGYRLTDVRLLKNACCHSVQCIIRGQSNDFVIFQQPKEHPFSFGNFPLEVGYTGESWYHKVEAGSYQSLSWIGQESRFVAVGEMVEKDIATIMNAVDE